MKKDSITIGHLSTWGTLLGLVVGGATFFDDMHGKYALFSEVETIQVQIDQCVTKDELTIALLERSLANE